MGREGEAARTRWEGEPELAPSTVVPPVWTGLLSDAQEWDQVGTGVRYLGEQAMTRAVPGESSSRLPVAVVPAPQRLRGLAA